MDLVTDFLLLAASATACLYCFVLSRRLKGLTSAKEGLGAGIAALSRSAEDVKTAVGGAKGSADAAAARIEAAILEADAKIAELRALADELTDMGAAVVAHAERSTKKYIETITPIIADAQTAASALLDAVEQAPAPQVTPIGKRRREADTVAIDDKPAKARNARAGEAA